MKFLCDSMLGHLARWLRIFGYDCELAPERSSDDEVIGLAEGRILLTRDKKLADVPDSFYIKDNDLKSQLKFLKEKLNLHYEIKPTHCSLCNSKLETTTSGWRCTKCNQEYWKGSHWDKINEFAETI